MTTSYQTDIVAWANEQAQYIRAGLFDKLDLEHLAEEIEDVGKSEKRELASRMAVLLAHLLKWKYQPAFRGNSWTGTIKTQRKHISVALKETPSLKALLSNAEWLDLTWGDAVVQAEKETGLDHFPDVCPWAMSDVLTEGWLP